MAINWNDNKVFNPNAPQRSAHASESVPRAAAKPAVESEQTEQYTETPSRMAEELFTDRFTLEQQLANDILTDRQGPPPVLDDNYIAGYLRENIGRNVRAEFPLPGGFLIDKTGILREVGVNYFVLEDYISRARVLCDMYSVKFVTIL